MPGSRSHYETENVFYQWLERHGPAAGKHKEFTRILWIGAAIHVFLSLGAFIPALELVFLPFGSIWGMISFALGFALPIFFIVNDLFLRPILAVRKAMAENILQWVYTSPVSTTALVGELRLWSATRFISHIVPCVIVMVMFVFTWNAVAGPWGFNIEDVAFSHKLYWLIMILLFFAFLIGVGVSTALLKGPTALRITIALILILLTLYVVNPIGEQLGQSLFDNYLRDRVVEADTMSAFEYYHPNQEVRAEQKIRQQVTVKETRKAKMIVKGLIMLLAMVLMWQTNYVMMDRRRKNVF